MKLAVAWMLTGAAAVVVASGSTKRSSRSAPWVAMDAAGVAGTTSPADVESADASPAFPPQPREDEAADLRRMVDELQAENQQLGTLDEEVAALRQDLADQRAEKQYEADEAAAQKATLVEVLDMLRRDENLLATGDTEGVDDDLAGAESALTGNALYEVQAAREALAREDIYPARQHIAAAIALGSPAH